MSWSWGRLMTKVTLPSACSNGLGNPTRPLTFASVKRTRCATDQDWRSVSGGRRWRELGMDGAARSTERQGRGESPQTHFWRTTVRARGGGFRRGGQTSADACRRIPRCRRSWRKRQSVDRQPQSNRRHPTPLLAPARVSRRPIPPRPPTPSSPQHRRDAPSPPPPQRRVGPPTRCRHVGRRD